MSKSKSYNYTTDKTSYFKDGRYYSDIACKKEIKLTDYENAKFWQFAEICMTGEDLYNLIKPYIRIGFYGETIADERSLDGLDKIGELVNALLMDLDGLSQSVTGRYEYSAKKLEERLKPILENIQEYSDEWAVKEESK